MTPPPHLRARGGKCPHAPALPVPTPMRCLDCQESDTILLADTNNTFKVVGQPPFTAIYEYNNYTMNIIIVVLRKVAGRI
jgi:hypothetical protein